MPEKYTPPGWRPSGPFTMILSDVKVYRYFGRRPELGKPIPGVGCQTVTKGNFTKIANYPFAAGKALGPRLGLQSAPTMALRRLGNLDRGFGVWEVKTANEHQNAATKFLMLKCGG